MLGILLNKSYFRFLWSAPIKSKKKSEIIGALKKIVKSTGVFQKATSDGELSYTGASDFEKKI